MSDQLEIKCGARDDNNNRAIVASVNGTSHRDCFDTDKAFLRGKFRERVISKFGFTEDAHEHIESRIIAAADFADSAEQEQETPNVTTMADVERKDAEWLWPGYIPAGAPTILDGDPSFGKSQVICSLAASITTGRAFPGEPSIIQRTPRGVLIMTPEDDPEFTIKGRLDVAGADSSKVHLLTGINSFDGEERAIQLGRDIDHIEQVVVGHDIAMVAIDPLVAFLDEGVNYNSDADVRRCLAPLARMAQRTRAAVVAIRHLNKKAGGSAMYRGGGSIGIIGFARAGYVVAESEDDPDIRVFACTKNNLARTPDSLLFTVEEIEGTSRVVWNGTSSATANDLLAGEHSGGGGKKAKAIRIIQGVLANGPRGEPEVWDACSDAGVSKATYWRARREIGVVSEKANYSGGWMVSLSSVEGCQSDY